jgi:hypothetical protein
MLVANLAGNERNTCFFVTGMIYYYDTKESAQAGCWGM